MAFFPIYPSVISQIAYKSRSVVSSLHRLLVRSALFVYVDVPIYVEICIVFKRTLEKMPYETFLLYRISTYLCKRRFSTDVNDSSSIADHPLTRSYV